MSTKFSGLIWLILGLGSIFSCQWTPSSESTVENYWLRGDTILIRLRDGSGWRLDIYQEGRGSIRYGSHTNNMLTFEQIGSNFDSIRRQLAGSHVKRSQQSGFRPPARIAFLINDGDREQSEVLKNIDLGREVFEMAFEASLNGQGDLRAKRRMLKLFKTNPPFGREY